MNEPICQHCGKTLYEALRQGCHRSPCKPLSLDFDEGVGMYRVNPKNRFNPVCSGHKWYVLDKEGSWQEVDNKKAAYKEAAYKNYCWEETLDGQQRFGGA